MATADRISIVIADDHPIFREGLQRLLEVEPDLIVTGTAADGQEALQAVMSSAPDILLLDLAMPRYPGMEVLREMRRRNVSTRTILLTAAIDDEQGIEALRLGARGIVLKDTATSLLVKCVRVVSAGQYWVGREAVSTLVSALRQVPADREEAPALFGLKPRQLDVVRAVATGATNRDIAKQFGISEDTVKQHLATAFDKCGVSSRVELALFAVHHKIAES
jgi:two-component system, NarL family, nitrate/nitrite response regulator NarL